MAYLRQDRPADAVKDCDSALRVDPTYKKALFRRGLAYKALKSWDEAADDLKAALSAEPGSKQILKELAAVERGQAEARKNRFKRMAVEEVGDDTKPAAPAAAPKKTFKRIAVEEDSDSDSDSDAESEDDAQPKQEAPPVAQTQPRRIVVEESSDDDGEEDAAPAKPAFTRVAVEEDSGDDDDSAEQEKAASPPPIAAVPRRIVVEESSSEDDEEQAAEPVPAPPVEEECPEALKIKAEGNLHFKGGRYEQAIEAYTRSLELLPREDHPEAVKIYSNRAACHAQGGNHRQVVADCNAALALEPTAIKALMRRSHALESLEKFESALDDMKTVLKIDWNIKEAQTARQRLESFVRAEHKMNGTVPKPKQEAWTEPAKAQPAAKQPEPPPKVAVTPKKRIVVEEDSSDDEEDVVVKKAEPAKTAPGPKVFEQPKRRIVVEEDSSDDEEETAETEPVETTAPTPKVQQPKKRIVVEEDSDGDSDDEDEVTPEERVANATKAKDQGNAAFKQRDFGEAVRLYTLAIECQCTDTMLVTSLYNNRAMAQLKVGAAMPEGSLERFSSFKQALKDTTTVLKTEPDNVKALFRKGQAYMGLDEYEHAARELAEVVKLQPTNKAAKTELAQANAKLAQIKTVEAAMSQHLAGSDGADDAPSSIVMPGTAKNQAKKGGKGPMISEVDASADKKNEKKSSKKKQGNKPMIIEEVTTNKNSTSSAKSSPKSSPRGMPAPLQLGKPSVPSAPPVSSTAFEQQYNRLKKYPELFCDYLQLIKPETLPKLFRSSITADMLLAIVSCLSSEFLGKRDMAKEAFKYMQNLSKINRMSTTLLAMTGGERAQLADLLDQLENIGGQAAGFAKSDIGPLRAVFA
jgi:tetratricopeptide (TPR) repeat protein